MKKKPKNYLFVVVHEGMVYPKIFDTHQQAVDWAQASDDVKGNFQVDSFTHPRLSREELRKMVQDMLNKSTSSLH